MAEGIKFWRRHPAIGVDVDVREYDGVVEGHLTHLTEEI